MKKNKNKTVEQSRNQMIGIEELQNNETLTTKKVCTNGQTPKIVKSGDCRGGIQLDNARRYQMNYTLTDDGVLTISGNDWLFPAPVLNPDDCSEYKSQFKDMDFHTVVIEPGIKYLDKHCFRGCKNLKKIVLPDKVPGIAVNFAKGTQLEYFNDGGLLFLGPESNPYYTLMGCTDDFNQERLVIPEGTIRISDWAFYKKEFICDVVYPESLEDLGRFTFEGTSIRNVYIPEGKLSFEEALFDLEGNDIESISLPYSMYKEYLNAPDCSFYSDWSSTTTIIFRNTDDSIVKVLPVQPCQEECSVERVNKEENDFYWEVYYDRDYESVFRRWFRRMKMIGLT